MSCARSVLGTLGAAAILVTSALALAATTETSLNIDASSSSIRIGSQTFKVGAGTLFGALQSETSADAGAASDAGQGAPNTCGFVLNAAKSNPTFQKVNVMVGVDAQLELCDDLQGTLGDTSSGSGTMSAPGARIKVKLSGIVNCEVPCVTINFTSNGNADGQDYTPGDGTVKLVDDQFAVPASTCGSVIDGFLKLPSPAGKNAAILSLQAGTPAPTCQH